MANTKSAKKAARQAERRRQRNRPVRTRVRTASKAVVLAVQAGDLDKAAAALRTAQSVLDRAAKRGVIHWRAAARRKSRLARRLSAALRANQANQDGQAAAAARA
jgi:small subunit ribosomal protein S20